MEQKRAPRKVLSTTISKTVFTGDAVPVASPPVRPSHPVASHSGTGTVRRPQNNPLAKAQQAMKEDKNAHPGIPSRVVVSMDERKLNKKQIAKLQAWRGAGKGKAIDTYWDAQLKKGRETFTHNSVIVAGDEANNLVIGIPMPSLAFEYLLCQDVLPLGLIMHLVGLPDALKSSLAFEMMRWIRAAGGGTNLFELESKYDDKWNRTITGLEPGEKNVIVDFCHSVEEWQTRLQKRIEWHQQSMEGTTENPGPGRVFPVGFFVDTIMGKASYETQDKVHKEGFAGRNFPVEALSITTFMKTVPQMIDEWPFFLCLLNHLKLGKNEQGIEQRNIAGGSGVKFQESFELECSTIKKHISCLDWDGRVIRIKSYKNSFGPSDRSIEARLLYGDEPDESDQTGQRRWACWDWHWSTVKMLTSKPCTEGRLSMRLKEEGIHVDVDKTGDATATAWSETLGIKKKDAIPWDQLGRMLADNVDVKERIRRALSIKRRPLLQGDYLEQMAGYMKKTE